MPDDDPLLPLSQAVADGDDVNWPELQAKANGPEVSAVEQLRLIAAIGSFHRSPDNPSHLVSLPAGSRWGSLQIIEAIAHGGFGHVYRAHDPRLQRDVALKVLARRADQGADDIAVNEARLLARVRHPNVVVVYGADIVAGEVGMWMEMIDGQTLSTWLAQHGLLGADEAVIVGITLCRALAAVHQAGLVHRDVKPQNVMREAGGRIVLMDFGAGRDIVDPAMRVEAGTPICLAPEILAGGPASASSDVYSLGVLLFFLVTGRYPASATTPDELKAWHAQHRHPSVRDVRPDLPPAFVEVVSRALESDPTARFESAGQFEQALVRCVSGAPPPAARKTGRLWAVALLAIVATIIVATLGSPTIDPRRPAAQAEGGDVVRFQIRPPDDVSFPFAMPRVTLSPDGRTVTFLAVTPESERRIWLQDLSANDARPLLGTEYAWGPAWSPDGRELVFISSGVIRRFTIATRATVDLMKSTDLEGLTWNSRHGIVFANEDGSAVERIAPEGGTPAQITAINVAEQEIAQRFPQFLPDARTLLYLSLNRQPARSAIYLTDVEGNRRTRLVETRAKALFVEPGILLYLHGATLYAQRLDVVRGALEGSPTPIATGIPFMDVNGSAEFFATTRTLVHGGRPRLPARNLQWVDRTGRPISASLGEDVDSAFAMSPDEHWLALERPDPETRAPDLWMMDLASGRRVRSTDQPANDEGPVWAPDSRRYIYARHPAIQARADLYVRDRTAPVYDEPVFTGPGSEHPSDWSKDGRLVLFDQEDDTGTRDIYLLPIDGDRHATAWLKTKADERRARFSPDGRWIAYESSEGGPTNIFVRKRDSPGRLWQVSSDGGTSPLWRGDGRELYFISARSELMASVIHSTPDFGAAAPARLFELRRLGPRGIAPTPFAVSADGQRFLIGALVDPGGQAPISVILNWQNLLK